LRHGLSLLRSIGWHWEHNHSRRGRQQRNLRLPRHAGQTGDAGRGVSRAARPEGIEDESQRRGTAETPASHDQAEGQPASPSTLAAAALDADAPISASTPADDDEAEAWTAESQRGERLC
jgi:hypothetical protein